jgi:AcrR family transcriptional regulator
VPPSLPSDPRMTTPMKPRSPSPGRPPAAALESREAHLFAVATAEFLAHGYGGASLARIARTARISAKTIYARYAGKEALLMAVVHRLVGESRTDVEEALGRPDAAPEEVLTAVALRIAEHWTSPLELGLYRLVIADAPRFPELARTYLTGVARHRALLADYLDRLSRRSILAIDDTDLAVAHFAGLTTEAIRNRALLGLPPGRDEIRRIVARGVTAFLRAYGAGAGPGG